MDDSKIVDLFYERSEQAICETRAKYAATIRGIAYNILQNRQDMEECENDTYLAAWNRIPPEKPDPLSAYLFRITRNLAIKRYRANTAARRNNAYDLALEELEEIIGGSGGDPADEYVTKELTAALERFLSEIDKEDRILFMCRYWYFDSVADIAAQLCWKPHRVSVRLSRIRIRLRNFLQKEGMLS